MKILVLGCNGMAGHTISLYLKKKGYKLVGLARQESVIVETIIGDVSDLQFVETILRTHNFNIVINCIGVLNQSAESDKLSAVFLNSYLPHFLVRVCEGLQTKIVHLSTDCVFSGTKGSYAVGDFTDGNTFYDKSKALGELNCTDHITLRCSIIGPDLKTSGIGLLNWFLQQNGTVEGYANAYWTGQTTLQLAKTIEFLLENNYAGGIYQPVPCDKISKYSLLQLIMTKFEMTDIKIIMSDQLKVDKSLVPSLNLGSYKIPGYELMLAELYEWIKFNKKLYPHYKL